MRTLNAIEQAFTLINDFYPLTPVCIIRFQKGPSSETLRSVLDRLQQSHPLLRAVITKHNGTLCFKEDEALKTVPLEIIRRKDDNHWRIIARKELNKGFKLDKGPLMKVIHIEPDSPTEHAEIIFIFHHAIIDATSLFYILHELMVVVGKSETANNKLSTTPFLSFIPSPDLNNLFPKSYKKPKLTLRLLPFLFRQLKDEITYRKELARVNDAKVPSSSDNDFIVVEFTKEQTLSIIKWTRERKLSMNNLIMASMLHSVNRFNYSGKRRLMRVVRFSNLRPYLKPPVEKTVVGCFASMMRFTESLSPFRSIAETAAFMDNQYLKSAKRGDKFLFAILSKMMVKRAIRKHNTRLGAAALSYAGAINFKQVYGNIVLRDFHVFITNNCLGAELSGFAKICFGRLSLDLNFLTAETSNKKAKILANEIKSSILNLIQ